jgi:division protein CdvB (Snf7/Vps24/ESCRT-III family)
MKKPTVATLALAIAAGRSIASWCRETGAPKRSAYRMAKTSECRQLVEEIRRRAVDRAIGELARHALKSAKQITRLATKAQSEAVQLAAARAGISDMMALADFAGLENRLASIEERLNAHDSQPSGQG